MKVVYTPEHFSFTEYDQASTTPLSSADGPPMRPNMRHQLLSNDIEYLTIEESLPPERFYYMLDINELNDDGAEANLTTRTCKKIKRHRIPWPILDRIQQGTAKFIAVRPYHGCSVDTMKFFIQFVNDLHNRHFTEKDFVFVLPSAIDSCDLNLIGNNIWEWSVGTFMSPADIDLAVRSHRFVCLNRLYSAQRMSVVLDLIEFYDRGILTMLETPKEYQQQQLCDFSKAHSNRYQQLKNYFPLIWDQPWHPDLSGEMVISKEQRFADAMKNCYLNIINETQASPTASWNSEKTYKAMIFGQSFILLGQHKNMLEHIRAQGYKTFEPWIDESYDQIDSAIQRVAAATTEAKRIITMPTVDIQHWQQNILEILQHNQSHLLWRSRTQAQRILDKLVDFLAI